MISLEKFVSIIQDIKNQDKKDEELTKLLVCKYSAGWISSAEPLIEDIIVLLETMFDDKAEAISGYIYDILDDKKYVYDWDNNVKYDINTPENLYYYLIGEYDKLYSEKIENIDVNSCTKNMEISGQEFIKFVMNEIENVNRK